MKSDSIVIAFDVAEELRAGLFDRFKDAVFNQFCLEPGKETFRLRVVITIAASGHRLPETARVKKPPVIDRSILAALVGVNNRSLTNESAPPRLKENVNDKLRRHSLRDFPTDNPARELVLKARQITKRAARQPQISNVADKHFTFARRRIQSVLQKIWVDCKTVL